MRQSPGAENARYPPPDARTVATGGRRDRRGDSSRPSSAAGGLGRLRRSSADAGGAGRAADLREPGPPVRVVGLAGAGSQGPGLAVHLPRPRPPEEGSVVVLTSIYVRVPFFFLGTASTCSSRRTATAS